MMKAYCAVRLQEMFSSLCTEHFCSCYRLITMVAAAVHSVRTGITTLHNYEVRSGLRIAMYTNNDIQAVGKGDTKAPSVREALQHIYSDIWVEYVVRSPLYHPGELIVKGGGQPDAQTVSGQGKFDIRSTNFERKLDAYLSSMPWFR